MGKNKKELLQMEMGVTNVALAEAEILNKRLDYIKDLCSDALIEPGNIDRNVLRRIVDICNNRTCNNCKYWSYENIDKGMVCVNDASEECANWTDANFTCKAFEKAKGRE